MSRTTSHSSPVTGSSQQSPKPIDLTSDTKKKSAKSLSFSDYPRPDTPTRTLTRTCIDLSLDDETEKPPSTPGRSRLKRKAERTPERASEDYTPSKDNKRRKHECDLTRDDDPSPELIGDDIENAIPVSEAEAEAGVDRFGSLIRPTAKEDKTAGNDTINLTIDPDTIDLTIDPDTIENLIDLDDILSDDDEIRFVGWRRCLKEKKKRKVRQVLDPSRQSINHVNVNGIDVQEGCYVEFQDGTFMKVCAIYPERDHESMLVGNIFTRITQTEILMPSQRDSQSEWKPNTVEICKLPLYVKGSKLVNEVCQRIKIAAGEAEQDKGLWRRPAREVKRLRSLSMTNQGYEDNYISEQHVLDRNLDEQTVEAEGELTCRWKEVITTDEYGKVKEHRLERPMRDVVSRELFAEDEYLRKAWRGTSLNLAASKTKPTMAEACCGAGGMTLGAQEAGLDVRVAFDIDADKIATHKLNFPTCESMLMDISDWIQWAEHQNLKVDVLHLSPPCQPFSPACTTPNPKTSEPNEAVLLACGPVIERVHPRVVTIEESDGLMNRHSKWFGALISQFTELGFSIRWACLKCSDFGVPQSRKRFFLIASAPGEDLPTFPEPTHELGTVSIQRTLDELEAVHRVTPLKYHDPASSKPLSRAPYDANCLAKTITCKGGDNYHPSGLRNFTVQEFLALQTFTNTFQFPEATTKTEMKAQLGNAVPPLVAKAILGSVVKSMIASDEKRLEGFGGASQNNAIEL